MLGCDGIYLVMNSNGYLSMQISPNIYSQIWRAIFQISPVIFKISKWAAVDHWIGENFNSQSFIRWIEAISVSHGLDQPHLRICWQKNRTWPEYSPLNSASSCTCNFWQASISWTLTARRSELANFMVCFGVPKNISTAYTRIRWGYCSLRYWSQRYHDEICIAHAPNCFAKTGIRPVRYKIVLCEY